jgi:hypothetical protein
MKGAISTRISILIFRDRWLFYQHVILNLSKCLFFYAVSPHQDHKLAPLPLEMGSGILQPSAEVKHLGVTFDSHLSMSSHIRNICRSSFFHLWRISKVRRFLDPLTTKGAFTLPLTQRYGAKRSVAPPGVTEEYVL